MDELIVVAKHGPDWIGQCLASLNGTPVLVVDTGPDGPAPGQHPTGAYLWAYQNVKANRYLFIQDSMTAVDPDPCPWFRQQMPLNGGAVAWGRFPMAWDGVAQQEWVRSQYRGVEPDAGIFGPVFYTTRRSLDLLKNLKLLPKAPSNRLEAQGTERAWAFAFHAAGLPVTGPAWNSGAMRDGFGPFRKVWANRP